MKSRILSVVLILGWLLITPNQSNACPPQNQNPIASVAAIPEQPPLDMNVMFDGSASRDPDGYITKYQWDFDYDSSFDVNYYETSSYHPDGAFDGITEHPYGSTGVYTVMLRVTDNGYATDTDTCKVYVGSVFNMTQGTAHSTIQAAINDSNDGDLIRVRPGMYGAIDFNDKKITVESSDPDNWAVVAQTIIDANGSGNTVTFDGSEDANSVLRGFTITGGQRGIYCYGTSPAIRNCVIVDNDSSSDGGGVYCNNASPSIINCVIAGNYSAANGGGLYCSSASPTLVNCVLSDNDADYGGGICDYNSSPDVSNCTFYGNIADANGGAMYNYGAASSPNVTNCILWGNGGGEIINDANANPNVTYCDVAGTYAGNGNINSDPNFMNVNDHAGPDGAFGTWDDGLRIMAYSPCVDAADGDAAPATDITGLGRADVPYADHNGVGSPDYTDIGAYESPTVWFVDVNVADSN
ncbi:MAG: PKD domain-containing protein, partial [Planctomycetota bacterium]